MQNSLCAVNSACLPSGIITMLFECKYLKNREIFTIENSYNKEINSNLNLWLATNILNHPS